jgi:hypothetical protein
MTYYFPLGRPVVPTLVPYSTLAVTASSAASAAIPAVTASFASTVINTPPSGPAGQNQDPAQCPPPLVGAKGDTGEKGDAGLTLTNCPSGTKLCPALVGPSPYPVVCVTIAEGCTAENTTCPQTINVTQTLRTCSGTTTTTSTSTTTSTTTSTSTTSTTSTTTEACNSYSYGTTEDINGCAQNYDLTLRVRGALANGKQVYTDEICSSPLLEAPFIQTLDAGTYTNYALNLSGVVTNVQINETCAGA